MRNAEGTRSDDSSEHVLRQTCAMSDLCYARHVLSQTRAKSDMCYIRHVISQACAISDVLCQTCAKSDM